MFPSIPIFERARPRRNSMRRASRLKSLSAVAYRSLLIGVLVCAPRGASELACAQSATVEFARLPVPAEPLPAPEAAPAVEGNAALGLSDLEAMALASNPSIARLAALVGAARGNWIQVGLPPNPVVGYEGQQIGSDGLAEQDGVVINQEIVRGGKLRLNRAVAAQEMARAEANLAAQRQRVLTDVRMAFYQVLVAQRQIDLARELIRINGEAARAADALFEAKEVGRADILQARLEVDNSRILANNAFNRHEAVWRGLTSVVGVADLAPQPLAGDVFVSTVDLNFDEALFRLQSASPEVAAAIADIDRARWAVERALVEPRPNVSLQGLVNWRDNGIGGRSDGAIGVTVPLPIFDRNQGAILEAQHELAAATRALEQLELELRSRLASVFERYASARQQVELYQTTILPTAGEALELTRQTYEVGEINYVTLLTAQRSFSQTNLNYLESILMLRLAEAEIEGLLLSGSLGMR